MTLAPAFLMELLDRLRALQAAYHAGDGDLVLHHLDAALQMLGDPPAAPAPPASLLVPLSLTLDQAKDRYVGAMVERAGTQERAALALQASRRTVQRALQRLRPVLAVVLFLLPLRGWAAQAPAPALDVEALCTLGVVLLLIGGGIWAWRRERRHRRAERRADMGGDFPGP